jgi:hypothetical protein
MGEVRPIPTLGGVVGDVRGAGRALRVSWHREDGLVVLSLWDGTRCTGTVRVAAADVPTLIEALQIGLRPEPIVPPPADKAPPPPADEALPPPAHEAPPPPAHEAPPLPADEPPPPHGLDNLIRRPEDGVAG